MPKATVQHADPDCTGYWRERGAMRRVLRALATVAALPLIVIGLVGMLLAMTLDRWLHSPATPERARRAGL